MDVLELDGAPDLESETILAIVMFPGVPALRPFFEPAATVSAQSARFEHVMSAATTFLYKGQQGMLVMDKRNGNQCPRHGVNTKRQ